MSKPLQSIGTCFQRRITLNYRRKAIGPLKRKDGSLAVDDKEKSNLVNNFFSNIGKKLAGSFQPQYPSDLVTSTKIVPCVNKIALSPLAIERKLANLKTNKATGPDDISPKIVKEAGDALLTPLMFLYESERWLCLQPVEDCESQSCF